MDSKPHQAVSEPPNSALPKITSIFDFTAEALEEFAVWLEQRGLTTPISQIVGFTSFTAQTSTVTATVNTTSQTKVSLTGGPILSGLPDGKYLVVWGGQAFGSAGVSNANMYVVANAATSSTNIAGTSSNTFTSVTAADTFSLKSGNNTLEVKYQSSDNVFNCGWQVRFLIALKYANA